jgi:hypothetical protein
MQVTENFACSCSDAAGSFEKLNTGRKIIVGNLWWKGEQQVREQQTLTES